MLKLPWLGKRDDDQSLTCSVFDLDQFRHITRVPNSSGVHGSDSELVQPAFFELSHDKLGSSDLSVLCLQRDTNTLGTVLQKKRLFS